MEGLMIKEKINIAASSEKVWDILTNPKFAKILGNEFDKNAFIESDWKLNSQVHFKYEPDKLVITGTITELIPNCKIHIDYKDIGYSESFRIDYDGKMVILNLCSGPYHDDYIEQIAVWKKWLLKVKELSSD